MRSLGSPTRFAAARRGGFSLTEIIVAIAVLGILTTIAMLSASKVQPAVQETKLRSDVQRLNQVISVYLAEGGSLAGLNTPQAIIDKLKTVRPSSEIRRNVGVMTGRGVDVRLSTRTQSSSEASSNKARAVWNASTQKFDIAYSGGAGIAEFTLDPNLAGNDYGTDTRTQTNELYNANNGWVWASGTNSALAALTPMSLSLSNPSAGLFDPNQPNPPNVAAGAPAVPLPAPTITPAGGSFYLANFPSSISIIAGNVPPDVSLLVYGVVYADGSFSGWAAYSTPFAVGYGDRVYARNITTDAVHYADSTTTTQTYYLMPTTLPVPNISPVGGGYLASAWPQVTIDSNGAPGSPYSNVLYMITHADGSSTSWFTYSAAITPYYGDKVTAKNSTLNAQFYSDSATTNQTYTLTGSTQLPPPLFQDYWDSSGKRYVIIYPDSSDIQLPPGYRIYYKIDGSDPGIKSSEDPVSGTLYDPSKMVQVPSNADFFEVTARIYPPSNDKAHWDTSNLGDYDINLTISNSPGLEGGHIDVDTSHLIYPLNKGSTDAHVHAYDDKYNVTYVDCFHFLDSKLGEIGSLIPNGQRFRLIMSNANLSPGITVNINGAANLGTTYDNTAVTSLPIYSMDGVSGSTKLTALTFTFANNQLNSGVIPTVTGFVRGNKVGQQGEARDGAFILQAVKVNADGSNAFTTNTALSNGGVQGVATSGLLWECTIFWHWRGGPY